MSFGAVAPGYAFTSCYPRTKSSLEDMRIELEPEHEFSGRVVDEQGEPVEGAEVVVSDLGVAGGFHITMGKWGRLQGVSDNAGVFTLNHFPDPDKFGGLYAFVTVSKPGRATVHAHLETSPGCDTLTLPEACPIVGTLYLPGKAGQAPEGTVLQARVERRWGGMEVCAAVDASGHFAFPDLPPGKASMILQQPKSAMDDDGRWRMPPALPWALPAVRDLEVAPGRPVSLELVLTRGALLTGKVIDTRRGIPARNADLEISHPGALTDELNWDHLITDANGRFTYRVAAGRAAVRLYSYDGYTSLHKEAPTVEVTVSDGEKRELVLRIPSAKSK